MRGKLQTLTVKKNTNFKHDKVSDTYIKNKAVCVYAHTHILFLSREKIWKGNKMKTAVTSGNNNCVEILSLF